MSAKLVTISVFIFIASALPKSTALPNPKSKPQWMSWPLNYRGELERFAAEGKIQFREKTNDWSIDKPYES